MTVADLVSFLLLVVIPIVGGLTVLIVCLKIPKDTRRETWREDPNQIEPPSLRSWFGSRRDK